MRRKGSSVSISLIALTFSCLGADAVAANLNSEKEASTSPPLFSWTGPYLGFNFGHTWSATPNMNVSSANVFDTTRAGWGPASALGASGSVGARLGGFFNGGQVGYNWQVAERLVLGVEADIQGAGVRGGGGIANFTPNGSRPGYAVTSGLLNRNLEYFGTVRGRVGYALTPTLLAYATGGLAYGGVETSVSIVQTLAPSLFIADVAKGDVFENRTGWSAGAGLEWAFARSLSAKLEYLYYDLGRMTLTNRQIDPLGYRGLIGGDLRLANATSATNRFDGHILRAGLNYKFDPIATSQSAPLFASPEFLKVATPAFADWRISVMPYLWAINFNGDSTVRDETVATNVTLIDAITRSSTMPLAFMGRAEARNGPFGLYGDLAWMQVRFSGSALTLRTPLSGVLLSANASGRLKQTLAIGEAGASYELARFSMRDDPGRITSIDAYAGLRYWNVSLDLSLAAIGRLNAPLLNIRRAAPLSAAVAGNIQWIDPVVGVGLRHQFAPGESFDMRADIGGFGAGSKFSWQFYSGYSHDFVLGENNLTGTVGYKALGVDYSRIADGQRDGINSVLHGPVMALSLHF